MPDNGWHLTGHIASHLLAMCVLAPLAAYGWRRRGGVSMPGLPLGAAVAIQLALVWGWHLPPVVAFAVAVPPVAGAMHVSVFLAAVIFWRAVLDARSSSPWRALAALLVTGKLVCLLGVLLTFAPRPLYLSTPAPADVLAAALLDQQLAGLLMLVACPLTYVLASVLIARGWLDVVERNRPWQHDAKVG